MLSRALNTSLAGQTVSPSNTKMGSTEKTVEMHTADNQRDVERKERNPRDLDHNPIVIQFDTVSPRTPRSKRINSIRTNLTQKIELTKSLDNPVE